MARPAADRLQSRLELLSIIKDQLDEVSAHLSSVPPTQVDFKVLDKDVRVIAERTESLARNTLGYANFRTPHPHGPARTRPMASVVRHGPMTPAETIVETPSQPSALRRSTHHLMPDEPSGTTHYLRPDQTVDHLLPIAESDTIIETCTLDHE